MRLCLAPLQRRSSDSSGTYVATLMDRYLGLLRSSSMLSLFFLNRSLSLDSGIYKLFYKLFTELLR